MGAVAGEGAPLLPAGFPVLFPAGALALTAHATISAHAASLESLRFAARIVSVEPLMRAFSLLAHATG